MTMTHSGGHQWGGRERRARRDLSFLMCVGALLSLALLGAAPSSAWGADAAGLAPSTTAGGPAAPSDGRGTCMIAPPAPWIKVDAVLPDSKAAAKDASGGVAHLLRDEQVHLGPAESFRRMAFRVLNEAGLQSASQLSIAFDPSYQTLVLHHVTIRRGSSMIEQLRPEAVRVIERESEIDRYVMNGQATAVIVVNDVRFGDIVDYAFTVRGSNPVFGGKFVNTVLLGWSEPVARFRHRMIVPAGRPVTFKVHEIEWPPITAEVSGGTEYLWVRDNLPGVPSEPDAPLGFIPVPWFEVSEFQSWEEVAAWAQAMLDPASVLRPQPIPVPFQPASATPEQIVQFVQDEIRYLALSLGPASHRPYPPDVVATRRFGDCKDKSVFLCVLLRARGIEARPALVNSFMREGISARLPSPLAFDHVIVRAVIGGQECWLDPTIASQGGPIQRRAVARFGRALVVGERSGELATIPDVATLPGRIIIKENYEATSAAVPARLSTTAMYLDSAADAMRASFASLSEDEFRRGFAGYYARQYPGLCNEGALAATDDRANNRVTIRDAYQIDGYWTSNATARALVGSFGSSWISGFLPMPSDTRRSAPLALPFPRSVTTTSLVLLPNGFEIRPDDKRVDNEWFRFESHTGFATNVISLICHIETKCDAVSPHKIREYRDAVSLVAEASSYNLTWDPLGAAGSLARAEAIRTRWFLAALLTLAIAVAAAIGLYLFDPRPPALKGPDRDLRLAGLGGWLLLFAAGLVFRPVMRIWFATFYFNVSATERFGAYINPDSPSHDPVFAGLVFTYFLYQVANVPVSVLLLALFFNRRSSFVAIMVACMCLDVAAIWCQVSGLLRVPEYAADAVRETSRAMTHTTVACLWIGYLLISRRSRNTFRRRRHRREHHEFEAEAPPPINPAKATPPKPIGVLPPRHTAPPPPRPSPTWTVTPAQPAFPHEGDPEARANPDSQQ